MIVAGGLYLLLPWLTARIGNAEAVLAAALLIGLAMRLVMLPSIPMLEDDYQRYLWDGGLVAHGHNPYRAAPSEVTEGALADLAAASNRLPERINHPDLRTIYPPVAQAAFALAHWLAPWELTAWRGLLLLCDLISLALLLALLRRLGRSPLWALIYWWNPLVVVSLFNAGHMDGLLPPLLLAVLLAAVSGRPLWATLGLVLAAGVKLWPALLLPLVWRPLLRDPRQLAVAVAIAVIGLAALSVPVVVAGLDRSSGFVAYGQTWAMNDAFFLLASRLSAWLLAAAGVLVVQPEPLVRAAIAIGLLSLALWLARKPLEGGEDLVHRAVILVAALFLTVPAQFPWYHVWLVPLLALRPVWALLLPTALLPLYYLRFPLDAVGRVTLFDHGLVWLEWLPVWGLLALTWLRAARFDARAREALVR